MLLVFPVQVAESAEEVVDEVVLDDSDVEVVELELVETVVVLAAAGAASQIPKR